MSRKFREFLSVLGGALFIGALAAVIFRYTVGWVQYGALVLLVALAVYMLHDLRTRYGR